MVSKSDIYKKIKIINETRKIKKYIKTEKITKKEMKFLAGQWDRTAQAIPIMVCLVINFWNDILWNRTPVTPFIPFEKTLLITCNHHISSIFYNDNYKIPTIMILIFTVGSLSNWHVPIVFVSSLVRDIWNLKKIRSLKNLED